MALQGTRGRSGTVPCGGGDAGDSTTQQDEHFGLTEGWLEREISGCCWMSSLSLFHAEWGELPFKDFRHDCAPLLYVPTRTYGRICTRDKNVGVQNQISQLCCSSRESCPVG